MGANDLPASPEVSVDRHADFVRLLTNAHRKLLAYLSTLVGNRHDAEDVLQQASVIMWGQFHTFTPDSDFVAWATTVAYYEAKNFLRISARAKVNFDDELLRLLTDERRAGLGQISARTEALEQCLGHLDESGRLLLMAVYRENMSIAGLAEQLGKSPKTLYNRLSLLRQSLAHCMEHRLLEGGGAT